jgi:hypothetical protein
MMPIGTRFKFKPVTINSHTWIVDAIFAIDCYVIRCLEDLMVQKSVKIKNLNSVEIITNDKTETNMERNLKLTIEQAQKLYKEQPSMRELLLTSFTKEELEGVVLRYWVEIGEKSGFYIGSDSMIYSHLGGKDIAEFNVFATKAQAKSALAMAQLSQLMKDLGDECNVDWTKIGAGKSCIKRIGHKLYVETAGEYYYFLAFKTREVALAFMQKHEQLIKDYFMI